MYNADVKIRIIWCRTCHSVPFDLHYHGNRHNSKQLKVIWTRINALWIKSCSAYNESITPHALGWLVDSRWTLLQAAAGRCHGHHLESMTSYQKSDCQSMSILIYLKNNPAKFHPNPIWNDGALGFLKQHHPTRTERITRTRCVALWDQFLVQKTPKTLRECLAKKGNVSTVSKNAH